MTHEKIVEILEQTGLPVAYDHFAEGESPDPPFICYNFSESSALISWGFQNLFFKNHPLFSQKHLTNQSKNAALRAFDQKVLF